MKKAPVLVWDVSRMLRMASPTGRAEGLHILLVKHHGENVPALSAIQMWRSRQSIPVGWLAAVVYALMKEGYRVFDMMARVPE